MKEQSHRNSSVAALAVMQVMDAVKGLDIEYLEESLKQMKSSLSTRQAAMVLDPNPHTAIERSQLEESKLKQLDLMLQLARNLREITEKSIALEQARSNQSGLERIFGI